MPHLQNFSVPSGNDAVLYVDVLTDVPMETIQGADIYWMVYHQDGAVPVDGSVPLISKSTADDIAIPGSPDMTFTITLSRTDLDGLLGNYYHEASLVGTDGGLVTIMLGLMTVTQAMNVIP